MIQNDKTPVFRCDLTFLQAAMSVCPSICLSGRSVEIVFIWHPPAPGTPSRSCTPFGDIPPKEEHLFTICFAKSSDRNCPANSHKLQSIIACPNIHFSGLSYVRPHFCLFLQCTMYQWCISFYQQSYGIIKRLSQMYALTRSWWWTKKFFCPGGKVKKCWAFSCSDRSSIWMFKMLLSR